MLHSNHGVWPRTSTSEIRDRFYVASKTTHAPMWRALREKQPRIISTWIDEAGHGETKCLTELWRRIETEVCDCDTLILYIEKFDLVKGAFIEAGMALAHGKHVNVVLNSVELDERFHPIGSWVNHPRVDLYQTSSKEEASETLYRLLKIGGAT